MSSMETGPGRYLLLFGSFLSPGDRGRGGVGRGRGVGEGREGGQVVVHRYNSLLEDIAFSCVFKNIFF